MTIQTSFRLAAVLLLSVSLVPPSSAQTVSATLLGSVSDPGGAAIPGAKVTATELETQVTAIRETNGSGNYDFPNFKPGIYSITVEKSGFKREVMGRVEVVVDTTTRIDVKLQVGDVSETVMVTAEVPLLQTDRADTGRQINDKMLEEMPLGVNRNFQSLLDLVPGTTEASFQHSQFFNASSSLQTQVNGAMRMGNNYQIEGVDDNQRTGLLQVLIPPSEAIQTVDVSTTNYNAELGRSIGAVVNVQLKSGSNAYHGQAYELIQNDAVDARAFFNPSVGHLVYNRVGGNIGGPIRRNRVFFFADYLRTMDHEANTNLVTIPSMAFRQGDLSGDPTHIVYDPASGNLDGSGRQPFPGNIIPPSRINPIAQKILAYLPPTNMPFNPAVPSNNYFALLPAQKTTDALDGKVDWAISTKDRLSARFSYSRPTVFQAPIFGDAGGPAQSAFQGQGVQKTYSAGINYNRNLSSTLLTEFRVGISHYHNEAQQSDYGKQDSNALGIPNVNVNQFTSGFLGINIGNFTTPLTGYSASLPWIRAEANIDAVSSWTKVVSNHAIKWGVDLRRVRDDLLQDQTYSPRGIFYFGTAQTSLSGKSSGVANDMASFLLDVPYQTARDVNTYFPAMRLWQIFSYIADNWKVSPKLTLDLGMRWELYPPATPAFSGGFSNYDYVKNQLAIAGIGGNPKNLGMQMRWGNLAPRLGVAYRMDNLTVFRAGFGMSYTSFPDNTYAYNYPVRANNVYTAPNTYAPAQYPDGTFANFERGFPAPAPIAVPASGIISNPDPTSTYYIIPLNYKNPYNEAWNAAVQRTLPWKFIIDLAYVGSHGVDTPAAPNLNAGVVPGAGTKGDPQYPRTATSQLQFQGFSSSYHSLQVKIDRRLSKGLMVTTSFTYQKAMSFQTGDDGSLTYYIDQRRNYARADFDRTLNYVQSFFYQLPGRTSRPWGGWKASGVLSLRSGAPFSITTTCNVNPGSSCTQNTNVVAPVNILGDIGPGHQWFDKSSFTQPTGLAWGTLGRNALTGPGTYALNTALSKTFAIKERYRMDVRGEAFNVSNTPQFSNPSNSFTSATFGQITSTRSTGSGVNGTGGGRVIQGGVKFSF
jgi:hypothetical protein